MKGSYKRQLSLFPTGKCEICNKPSGRFVVCKNNKCVTQWKTKYLKDGIEEQNH